MNTRVRSAIFAVSALLAASSSETLFAGVGSWTSNGPEGAIVLALAADPSNPATVYAATDRRVYKSVDAGALWAPTGLSDYVNLILTTSYPSVVYVTTIESHGAAFHRTRDGGESWDSRAGPGLRLVSATVDPKDPMVIYGVTSGGIYRSTNGGDSWERLTNQPNSGVWIASIAVDPADSHTLFAGVISASDPGVYRSLDRGMTWNRTNFREPTSALLFDPSDRSRLFALTPLGVSLTTNAGESWARLAPGESLLAPTDLAIDPADSKRLYVVSGGIVFKSSDGGQTFARVPEGTSPRFVETIIVSGSSMVLAGSAKGISRSESAGEAWSASNRGIHEVSASSLAIDRTDPAVVFAATLQGIYESRDGGGSWNQPSPESPPADVVAVDPTNRAILYAGGWGGVQKSTDGGRTWEKKSPLRVVDYIADLVVDPSNPRRVFASYESVFRSVDGGENWDVVMQPENVASFYYPPTIDAIAIEPSDSTTVYVGGAGGDYSEGFLYRSDDGGTQWSFASTLRSPVRALAVDPCDPRIVYAGTYGGVYRSADGGNTWSEPELRGTSITSLTLDPRHSSSVFAGTVAGFFWTNDSGASWTLFEPALTEPVSSLAIDASGRFLHAGTARGVVSLERSFDPCVDGSDRLCLMAARFRVALTTRNPSTGQLIAGEAVDEGDRFGYFSFPTLTGDPDYPEVFVKMADTTGLPLYGGNVWVFHSALTDLAYTLTVHDTQTGRVQRYQAQRGASPALTCGEADTTAFAGACGSNSQLSSTPGTELVASGNELALLDGRFRATIRARDPRTDRIVDGAAIARGDGFGYFSLPGFTGDPSFPEVFVKMTGPDAGGYFGVFHTGLTDLEYTLTVTDQVTGVVKTYRRGASAGTELCGEADTAAFRN